MNKSKIEWTDYTWNPVTGCKKGCFYCYGKKINDRFGKDFKPRMWWDRLDQPIKEKKPSKIFVCSMADLFGDWLPDDTINYVLDTVRKCPHHTFQFLTKNPKRYYWFPMPDNCWRGVTITKGKAKIFSLVDSGIRFVSCEPLLGWIDFKGCSFDWIIIGAMTGHLAKKYQPKYEWIQDILYHADSSKIPVFMKNNLKPIWKGKLRQEFPNA
ncbi:MAG TPA: DUF5131 family protein [Candidatus Scalindua sp.]|nr:DUF5131 family protein [Candidatus Scalindua sp.]